jgi:hypothetical protein
MIRRNEAMISILQVRFKRNYRLGGKFIDLAAQIVDISARLLGLQLFVDISEELF